MSRRDIDGKKAFCRCGGKGVVVGKCYAAHLVLTAKVDSGVMSVVDTYKSVVHRGHPQTAVAVGDYVVDLVHLEAFRRVDMGDDIAIAIMSQTVEASRLTAKEYLVRILIVIYAVDR